MKAKTRDEIVEQMKVDFDADVAKAVNDVEVDMLNNMQYSLADAIEEGSKYSTKALGWGSGDTMCALSAAYTAAKARGYA